MQAPFEGVRDADGVRRTTCCRWSLQRSRKCECCSCGSTFYVSSPAPIRGAFLFVHTKQHAIGHFAKTTQASHTWRTQTLLPRPPRDPSTPPQAHRGWYCTATRASWAERLVCTQCAALFQDIQPRSAGGPMCDMNGAAAHPASPIPCPRPAAPPDAPPWCCRPPRHTCHTHTDRPRAHLTGAARTRQVAEGGGVGGLDAAASGHEQPPRRGLPPVRSHRSVSTQALVVAAAVVLLSAPVAKAGQSGTFEYVNKLVSTSHPAPRGFRPLTPRQRAACDRQPDAKSDP